ncbi:alpha/beta hydrolase [Nonlabens sp. MB-3u-79]|uniref:alpha/beta hydrolase n=1 Tax=Nonlabens sp. MB-3u-79 TaxID=2058134 RepID=UPI000C30B66F|nr:alpha/beta family hydrolase [Nonlabens sp. MB-3u-79]AUC80061.1 alpha/beta hydrolase [Nonlabens sp. MB-3u-79]
MAKKWSKRKVFRIIWLSFGSLFFIWNWNTFQSHQLPENTFLNNDLVSVLETDDQITFTSALPENKLEVIFFQGGLTDPKAYAPLCRKIAEKGFTCHLIKMEWRLPQYRYQEVFKFIDLKAGNYVIGGHSQGGKMAAQMVHENPTLFKGLFLMGTSHPRDIDLSNQPIPCIKLYADRDGLASVEEVMENKSKLPKNSNLILIAGGNHSQFGYLGQLLMDSSSKISLEEQQKQTIHHLITFMNSIKMKV